MSGDKNKWLLVLTRHPTVLRTRLIDDLMKHADSKYALAIFAAKRARQINSYFTQLNEGLLQNIGPLVEYQNNEKTPVHRLPRNRRGPA